MKAVAFVAGGTIAAVALYLAWKIVELRHFDM